MPIYNKHIKPRESLYIWALTKGSLLPNPLPFTNKASWFVLKYHKDEKREDGSDYSSHPLDACRIGLNFGLIDDATLTGILLHDGDENGKISIKKIAQEYNQEIASIVDNQTKRQGETTKDYYKRISNNVKSIIGKGCDRLSNLGTLVGVFDIQRTKKYSKETKEYVLPMLEDARHRFLKYSDTLVAIRDGIERIIKVIDAYVKEVEKNNLAEKTPPMHLSCPKQKNNNNKFIPLSTTLEEVRVK